LRAGRRDLNRLRNRIAGERQIGRADLLGLIIGQRKLLLDAAVGSAEQVRRVARGRPDLKQIEVRRKRNAVGGRPNVLALTSSCSSLAFNPICG
jgi:hypothetical protein